MPKVSILAPTYNHEKYVGEFIQSVLAQSMPDFELLVTDDGSRDGTVEAINAVTDPRLKLFRHETNQGIVPATRTSWSNSSGEYIAWIGTDDVCEPHMLQTLASYLDENPAVLGVFGLPRLIDDRGQPFDFPWDEGGVGKDRFQLLNMLFRRQRPICAPASMLRRAVLSELGCFPAAFGQSQDTAQWIRILFAGDLAIIPEYVIRYRRHNGAHSGLNAPACLNRTAFENFELLFLYLEGIDSSELLLRIFPEISSSRWPVTDELVPFHLAHLALSVDSPSNKLFGLHLLHKLMREPAKAAHIQAVCGFTYQDLFAIEDRESLFSHGAIQCELQR